MIKSSIISYNLPPKKVATWFPLLSFSIAKKPQVFQNWSTLFKAIFEFNVVQSHSVLMQRFIVIRRWESWQFFFILWYADNDQSVVNHCYQSFYNPIVGTFVN